MSPVSSVLFFVSVNVAKQKEATSSAAQKFKNEGEGEGSPCWELHQMGPSTSLPDRFGFRTLLVGLSVHLFEAHVLGPCELRRLSCWAKK